MKARYLLDTGKRILKFEREEDVLKMVLGCKELLKENNKKNLIFCVIEDKKKKKEKLYSLVDMEYTNRDKMMEAVKGFKKRGFTAYYIE